MQIMDRVKVCRKIFNVYENNLLFKFTLLVAGWKAPDSSAALIQKKKYGQTQPDFEDRLEIMISTSLIESCSYWLNSSE